jgi:5-methylthioribose kinase
MVTENDTRVIDPEFAFYGPMGFDIGAVIANLLLAAFAQGGQEKVQGERAAYAGWILQQIPELWNHFVATFSHLVSERTLERSGDLYHPRVIEPTAAANYLKTRFEEIWQDTLGFTSAKMVRRILGLAHVEDMETIADESRRAKCEARALLCAREIILCRSKVTTPGKLVDLVHSFLVDK